MVSPNKPQTGGKNSDSLNIKVGDIIKTTTLPMTYEIRVTKSEGTASETVLATTSPTQKDIFDSGNIIDLVRDNSIITPLGVAKVNYLAQGEFTKEKPTLIDGENQEVYAYTRGNLSMKIIPPKGEKRGLEPILEAITNYYDFWDTNHLDKEADIELDSYLDFLKYKRDENGSHDRKVKKSIWLNLIKGGTMLPTFGLDNGGGVFRQTLITVIGYYDSNNTLKDMESYIKGKPPKRFRILIPEALYNQMRGYKNQVGYHSREVVISGKIPPEKRNRQYLGHLKKVKDYIEFQCRMDTRPVRFLTTTEIDKAIGGQKSLIKQKREKDLNQLQSDKYIGDWGYSTSHNKRYNKHYGRMPYVWIDRLGTPTFELALRFGHKAKSEKAKTREAKKQKETIKGLVKEVRKIKKRQNEDY